jgi:hypothetical protein
LREKTLKKYFFVGGVANLMGVSFATNPIPPMVEKPLAEFNDFHHVRVHFVMHRKINFVKYKIIVSIIMFKFH